MRTLRVYFLRVSGAHYLAASGFSSLRAVGFCPDVQLLSVLSMGFSIELTCSSPSPNSTWVERCWG